MNRFDTSHQPSKPFSVDCIYTSQCSHIIFKLGHLNSINWCTLVKDCVRARQVFGEMKQHTESHTSYRHNSRPNVRHTMMKISLDDPDNNQSGTSLPIKRAQEQLSNDLGPSQVVSDNDDGGPPSKRKHLSQTAIADGVLDGSSPLKKTPARPRRQVPNAQKFLKMAIRSTSARVKLARQRPKTYLSHDPPGTGQP